LVKTSRILVLVTLTIISVTFWFINLEYPDPYLLKAVYSFLVLSVTYFVFWILLEELVTKGIRDSKTRYSIRKVFSILGGAVFLIALVAVWIVETQNILIAVGLIGAAIAFALQDVFKNFIGGVMIFLNGLYRAGDRVEIDQKFGDVIDIGVFYTTLMETREWVSGDQVTGRLTLVPNGAVLTGSLHNYTRDFDFIWDEIVLPVTYESDWNQAVSLVLGIVKKETETVSENAQKTMEKLEGKYYFTRRSLEPAVFVSFTDNWINLAIRYVTEVRSRRQLHDHLSRIILAEIEKSENVKIASSTITITGFPPLQIKKDENS
jgi:small-conductance mechanosensitive channel